MAPPLWYFTYFWHVGSASRRFTAFACEAQRPVRLSMFSFYEPRSFACTVLYRMDCPQSQSEKWKLLNVDAVPTVALFRSVALYSFHTYSDIFCRRNSVTVLSVSVATSVHHRFGHGRTLSGARGACFMPYGQCPNDSRIEHTQWSQHVMTWPAKWRNARDHDC